LEIALKKHSKILSESGFSVIEVFSVSVIICIIIGIIVFAVSNYQKKAAVGTDKLNMITAKNLAEVNINETGNIFGNDNLTHIGYYDDKSNQIVADIPKGYNKYSVMTVDKVMYTGAPGTMVIRITYDGKNIKYDWVEDH
jgi:Tfp pilus assembly protein PilV